MAQLGVQPHVIGHVLNHRSTTRSTVTTAVYVTYAYGPEKRTGLDLWASRLAAIVEGRGADVVPIRASLPA